MKSRKGVRFRPKTQATNLNAQEFQTALAFHQNGNLARAKEGYERILKANPGHYGALHLSGLICYEEKQFEDAVTFFLAGIRIAPEFAPLHSSHGVALQELKRFEDAIRSYDAAIAVKADYAEAYYNRGNALQDLQRYDDAIASYEKAVAIEPGYAEAYANRGDALQRLKRLDEALSSYAKAIAIKPDYAEAFANCGLALHALERFEDALDSHDKAIALAPDLSGAHFNRANALQSLKRFEDALHSYKTAIAISPDYAEAYSNLGDALHDLQRLDEALASYDKAVAIKPDYAEAWSNRAIALKDARRFDEALASYDKAMAIDPDYAEGRFNKGLALLLTGHLTNGFELYEWRKKNTFSAAPVWRGGESLRDKKILICEEQGVGDVIQFSRYAKLLQAMGAKVTFIVTGKLVNLMKSLDGEIDVRSLSRLPGDDFDFHSPLMSLALAFRTSLETIPAQTPYLFPDPDRTSAIRDGLLARGAKKICGLSWSSLNDKTGMARSVTLNDMFNIIDPAGYTFVNLQYGDVVTEIGDLLKCRGIDVVSFADIDNYADMDGFAALVDACDVVLSIDNTTLHMAGALNKTTLAMLPYSPDWRWMLDRQDSPWYPSMRLFRQDSPGDWDGVFAGVKAALTGGLDEGADI